MNSLDKFLMGIKENYEYVKYGEREYGIAKLIVRDRFVLIYETSITDVLDHYYDKAEFKGIFDKDTEIIYIESEHYNLLYNDSKFKKVKISTIQSEMDTYVKDIYNKYIIKNKQNLKAKGYPKFKEFYDVAENGISLREELETAYKDNLPLDYTITFGLETPIKLNDFLDYIVNKEKYADRVITDKLNKKDVHIYSHYSGIPDLVVSQEEYIGFELVKQEYLNEMSKKIDEGKDERSPILRKLRAIRQFIMNNNDIKNIIIGFTYNDTTIEVTYPIKNLERLDIESYYMPVKDRDKFSNLFSGITWQEREKILDAIQYFKYKGKIAWDAIKGE